MTPDFMPIYLTQNQVALVDFEDWLLINHLSWFAVWDAHAQSFYAARAASGAETKRMFMHRQIMGDPKGFVVDHRNHNTLNNRRYNLRVATNAQNVVNSFLTPNSSGIRGVYFHSRDKRWLASIGHGNRLIHLGSFGSAEEAAQARAEAVKKYHGEFAPYAEA